MAPEDPPHPCLCVPWPKIFVCRHYCRIETYVSKLCSRLKRRQQVGPNEILGWLYRAFHQDNNPRGAVLSRVGNFRFGKPTVNIEKYTVPCCVWYVADVLQIPVGSIEQPRFWCRSTHESHLSKTFTELVDSDIETSLCWYLPERKLVCIHQHPDPHADGLLFFLPSAPTTVDPALLSRRQSEGPDRDNPRSDPWATPSTHEHRGNGRQQLRAFRGSTDRRN